MPAIDIIVEEIPLAGFNDVTNNTNIEVIVVPDVEYSMTIEAEDMATIEEIVPIISPSGTLTIDAPANVGDARVIVHAPVVGKITINKNGGITAHGDYSTLDIDMKGNGNGTITGTAQQLRIMGGGNGSLDALGMPAIDVVVNLKGNSSVRTSAQSTLNVDLGGSAKVYYSGNPAITKKLKGNSQLIKL